MPRISKVHDVVLLKKAITQSTRIRQALIHLDLVPVGGNYATLKRAIERYNLDTSHFTGQSQIQPSKGIVIRPLSDYLTNKTPIKSYHLKQKLIRHGIKEARCEECLNTEWLGKPIPLELDHVDGNSNNNRLENLKVICPNCHAFTPTYRGRNRKKNQCP